MDFDNCPIGPSLNNPTQHQDQYSKPSILPIPDSGYSDSNIVSSVVCSPTLSGLTMDAQDANNAARNKPGPKPLQSSSPKTQYLILYNFVSALLWLVVLGRVVLLVPLVGFGRTYAGVGRFTKWTQTAALLEVIHAASGKCTHSIHHTPPPPPPSSATPSFPDLAVLSLHGEAKLESGLANQLTFSTFV